jgi:hypothetical protein
MVALSFLLLKQWYFVAKTSKQGKEVYNNPNQCLIRHEVMTQVTTPNHAFFAIYFIFYKRNPLLLKHTLKLLSHSSICAGIFTVLYGEELFLLDTFLVILGWETTSHTTSTCSNSRENQFYE